LELIKYPTIGLKFHDTLSEEEIDKLP